MWFLVTPGFRWRTILEAAAGALKGVVKLSESYRCESSRHAFCDMCPSGALSGGSP
jgi:hypothetical protein